MLNEDLVRASSIMAYFVSPETEIVVPRRHDSVMRPPVGFSTIYLDHLKVGLRFPSFPLLIFILNYYRIALPPLVPNTTTIVIVFQLFYDEKRVEFSISPFCTFLLKNDEVSRWYSFTSCRLFLKVKTPKKNTNSKDNFFYFVFLLP